MIVLQISTVVEAAKKPLPVKKAQKAIKKVASKAKSQVKGGASGAAFWYGPDRPGFLGKSRPRLSLLCRYCVQRPESSCITGSHWLSPILYFIGGNGYVDAAISVQAPSPPLPHTCRESSLVSNLRPMSSKWYHKLAGSLTLIRQHASIAAMQGVHVFSHFLSHSLREAVVYMQVTTDGTQPDSQQTPRPFLATARLRSSTLAGPCLEPSVRPCPLVPLVLGLTSAARVLPLDNMREVKRGVLSTVQHVMLASRAVLVQDDMVSLAARQS